MAILRLNYATKDIIMAAIRDAIGNGGLLKVYAGTMPADITTAISGQLLLGTLTFGSPSGTVDSGLHKFVAGAITQDSAADNGGVPATFARIFKADGTTIVMDIDVGVTGSGATLQLNTTNIVAGGPILVTSFEITLT